MSFRLKNIGRRPVTILLDGPTGRFVAQTYTASSTDRTTGQTGLRRVPVRSAESITIMPGQMSEPLDQRFAQCPGVARFVGAQLKIIGEELPQVKPAATQRKRKKRK